MPLVDLIFKIGARKIDSRNLIRNALIGWAKEDSPNLVLAIINMIVNECLEAKKIITGLTDKNKTSVVRGKET